MKDDIDYPALNMYIPHWRLIQMELGRWLKCREYDKFMNPVREFPIVLKTGKIFFMDVTDPKNPETMVFNPQFICLVFPVKYDERSDNLDKVESDCVFYDPRVEKMYRFFDPRRRLYYDQIERNKYNEFLMKYEFLGLMRTGKESGFFSDFFFTCMRDNMRRPVTFRDRDGIWQVKNSVFNVRPVWKEVLYYKEGQRIYERWN